jgi:hypothetical protein
MGWSCSAAASKTLAKWEAICRASTGSSNTWKASDGREYFYEGNGKEYRDGRIVGAVYGVVPCARVAGFVINADGSSDGLRFMAGSAVASADLFGDLCPQGARPEPHQYVHDLAGGVHCASCGALGGA